jgi:hypothetical protein
MAGAGQTMSDADRITALETRLNDAEMKTVQATASLLVAMSDIVDLKNFKARTDQLVAGLAAQAQAPPGMKNPSPEAALKNYEINCAQITTWVDLLGKSNIWYLAVTTAVVSYCLARPGTTIRLALVLPFLVGLAQICFYFSGLRGVKVSLLEIERLATRLQLLAWPDARVLRRALLFNIGWLALVLFGLAWLFVALPSLRPFKVTAP